MANIENGSYKIEFKRATTDRETQFVPISSIHRHACQQVLAGRYYEPYTHDIIARLLLERPGNMVHAGTFFGDMLPSFSRKCPGTVYAFEPVLEHYVLAKLCVQKNGLENVILLNSGLGAEFSSAYIDTGETKGSHLGGASQIAETGELTALVPIDAFDLQDISIVQLDVEGFELEALKGAIKTITTNQPSILIEDNAGACSEFLAARGYEQIGTIPCLFIGDIPCLSVWSPADRVASISEVFSAYEENADSIPSVGPNNRNESS